MLESELRREYDEKLRELIVSALKSVLIQGLKGRLGEEQKKEASEERDLARSAMLQAKVALLNSRAENAKAPAQSTAARAEFEDDNGKMRTKVAVAILEFRKTLLKVVGGLEAEGALIH